jgi:hypothetical protein
MYAKFGTIYKVLNPHCTILYIVAVIDLFLSAVLSTIVTVPTMLILYHAVIIPKILAGVKEQLPPTILTIVDEKIQDVKEYIQEQITTVKAATLGKLGNKKRLENLAIAFLEKNGVTPETLDTVAQKYGTEIVEALRSKAAAGGSVNDPFGKISE